MNKPHAPGWPPRLWPTVALPATMLTYSSMMATGQEEGMGDPPAFSTWLFHFLAERQLPYPKVLDLWKGGGQSPPCRWAVRADRAHRQGQEHHGAYTWEEHCRC